MLGELVPTGGGDPIPLRDERLTVGRSERCDITLRFGNVSGKHCELRLVDGYWKAIDLGSTNGIRINGERTPEGFVSPGDLLRIASHEYELDYKPAPGSIAPEPVNPMQTSLLEKAGLAKPQRRPEPAREEAPRAELGEDDDDFISQYVEGDG